MYSLPYLTSRVPLLMTSLGYETVLHFARNNASRIIIASRNGQKCQAAAEQVYRDVPTYRGKVDVKLVDLASFQSIIDFASGLEAEQSRLDFVVANAGVIKAKYGSTKDGYEEVLQVNGLSTGLMSLLLLPILAATAKLPVPTATKNLKPALCVVASDGEYMTAMWADISSLLGQVPSTKRNRTAHRCPQRPKAIHQFRGAVQHVQGTGCLHGEGDCKASSGNIRCRSSEQRQPG
jgi:NAD(P)-dependent dehydrogenase (short-subunit alcohol dehydrogenase family)